MKTSENRNGENILSSWLPPRSEKSSGDDPSLKIQEKASIWLGADPLEKKPQISTKIGTQPDFNESIIRIEKKPQISAKIGTQSDFNESIIRIFSGEPTKVVPPIQNQRDGLSMLDFLGRGFAIHGPANHSQPSISRHQQHSVNQKSLLDFMTNPFASPSSTIVAPRVIQPNNHKATIIYC